jgi:hypothetical protein
MRKARKSRKYWVHPPTAEQRAFVCAAAAVGLAPEAICREFPRGKKGMRAMTPDRLAERFADELKDGENMAARRVALRMLQRALVGDDREAMAAQMAVFKSLPDWRQLYHARPQEAEPLRVERLTDEERTELRRLIDKADPKKMEDEAD